jgi:hypothetical protein
LQAWGSSPSAATRRSRMEGKKTCGESVAARLGLERPTFWKQGKNPRAVPQLGGSLKLEAGPNRTIACLVPTIKYPANQSIKCHFEPNHAPMAFGL